MFVSETWWSGQSRQTVNLVPAGFIGSNPIVSTLKKKGGKSWYVVVM